MKDKGPLHEPLRGFLGFVPLGQSLSGVLPTMQVGIRAANCVVGQDKIALHHAIFQKLLGSHDKRAMMRHGAGFRWGHL